MKALGLGIAAALLLATAPVMAADLVVDVPDDDIMAVVSGWDGAYAGFGGIVYTGPSSGVGIVGNVGVNQTFGGNLLLGAELYAGGANDSATGLFWLVGAQGRLGVLASDTVLLYGAGGVEFNSPATTYLTLGGGIEFEVADNTTLDIEYKNFVGSGYHQIGVSLNFGF